MNLAFIHLFTCSLASVSRNTVDGMAASDSGVLRQGTVHFLISWSLFLAVYCFILPTKIYFPD